MFFAGEPPASPKVHASASIDATIFWPSLRMGPGGGVLVGTGVGRSVGTALGATVAAAGACVVGASVGAVARGVHAASRATVRRRSLTPL